MSSVSSSAASESGKASNASGVKPRVALFLRYPANDHHELCHAMKRALERLSETCEVHYFCPRPNAPGTEEVFAQHATIHHLPFCVDRKSTRDKLLKLVAYLFCLPWISLQCRWMGVRAIYMDETVPLSAGIAQVFFGPKVALTVADFFLDIYFEPRPLLKPVGQLLKELDYAAWRRLPLIITHARATGTFLEKRGVPKGVCKTVYDPCDFRLYGRLPEAERVALREKFGFAPEDVVLVHHGILHPNKGLDAVLAAFAPVAAEIATLRFLIIGDGPEMQKLRAVAEGLKLGSRVIFTGWLPKPTDVGAALNACDIGLVARVGHASDDFHTTGALVHNMACALPILAARLGGVSEIIREGEDGFLYDPRKAEEFQMPLRKLALDAALRRRLGDRAEELARENFDMERVATTLADSLSRLAGAGSIQ